MSPRKELPHIELEINIPVVVKPWQCRGVTTKFGPKLMLVVKEGDEEKEIPWLPVDLANDLAVLRVLEIGAWPDGNPKYTVLKGAPDIVVCKRQAKGDEHPHYEVGLATDDSGPEMPQVIKHPASPSLNPVPDRGEDVLGPCVTEAIAQTKRIASAFGLEVGDPLVDAALVEAAKSLASTLYIQRHR